MRSLTATTRESTFDDSAAGPHRLRSFVSANEELRGPMNYKMKSILDRSFLYTSSAATDLRKTFDRIRREQRRQSMAESLDDAPVRTNLSPMRHENAPAT